jgi:hypothetical protein
MIKMFNRTHVKGNISSKGSNDFYLEGLFWILQKGSLNYQRFVKKT